MLRALLGKRQRRRSVDAMPESDPQWKTPNRSDPPALLSSRYISGRVSPECQRGANGQRRVSNCRAIKLPLPATSEDQRLQNCNQRLHRLRRVYTRLFLLLMVGVKPRHSLKLLCKPHCKAAASKDYQLQNYLSSYNTSSHSHTLPSSRVYLQFVLAGWQTGEHYGN